MYCKYCGKELKDGSSFCKYCGQKVVSFNRPPVAKEKRGISFLKISLVLLCVLLVGSTAGGVLFLSHYFSNHQQNNDSHSGAEIPVLYVFNGSKTEERESLNSIKQLYESSKNHRLKKELESVINWMEYDLAGEKLLKIADDNGDEKLSVDYDEAGVYRRSSGKRV